MLLGASLALATYYRTPRCALFYPTSIFYFPAHCQQRQPIGRNKEVRYLTQFVYPRCLRHDPLAGGVFRNPITKLEFDHM